MHQREFRKELLHLLVSNQHIVMNHDKLRPKKPKGLPTMAQQLAGQAIKQRQRIVLVCEEALLEDEADGVGKSSPPSGRVSSGSALLRSRSDASTVIEALVVALRVPPFSDRDLFGIRVGLELAIDAVLASTDQGMRVRYHLGPDGLLIDVEAHQNIEPQLSEQALHLLRHFMTEARAHERGVTLYRRVHHSG
jgi:hypothetical protein